MQIKDCRKQRFGFQVPLLKSRTIYSPAVLGLRQRDAVKAVWVVHSVHFALVWEARKPRPFFDCRLFVALSVNVPFVL